MSLKPTDFYDGKAWKLIEERDVQQREQKAAETILKYIQSSKKKMFKILDVGCGDGIFLGYLAQKLDKKIKIQYFGVDYSKYRLNQAKEQYPFEFKFCNLEKGIPYEDGEFDIVYSGEVIEHIYNPDYMLEESWRVLRPTGRLILSTPNLHTWYNRFLFLFGIQPLFYETSTKSAKVGGGALARFKQDTPVGHIRLFNRTSITDLLKQEGFELVSFEGAIFHALPRVIQAIDKFFAAVRPTLASNMVVTGRKVDKQAS